MPVLAVVRHGHYDSKEHLSPLGRRQMRAVGEAVKSLCPDSYPPLLFTSTVPYASASSAEMVCSLGPATNAIPVDCLSQEHATPELEDILYLSHNQVTIIVTHLYLLMDLIELFLKRNYRPVERIGDKIFLAGGGCFIDHRERTITSIPVKLEA